MIKLQIANVEQIADEYYHKVNGLVRLDVFNKKERSYIETNLERIILAKKNEFKTIIEETKSFNLKKLKLAFLGSQKQKKLMMGSSNGYKKFSNKSTKPYNAYTLAKKLNVNVCPYCNRGYTHTIKSVNNKSTRPEFDHFICKDKHPIFALSFYNLIPSCSICNSSLKGQSKFYYETHIHPYFDDFDSLKRFTVDKTLLSLVNKDDEFEIVLKDKVGITLENKLKADNHIKDFALDTIYNVHKDKVLELVDLSRVYNDDAFKNIFNNFKDTTKIFKTEDEVKRLFIGHHIENRNIDKRPLNKLVKDISEELELI